MAPYASLFATVNVRDEACVPALYSQLDKQFVALTSVASMVTLEGSPAKFRV